jgi:hypothetical protein
VWQDFDQSTPMKLIEVHPQPNWALSIIADDGSSGVFDVRPYLNDFEAFVLHEGGQTRATVFARPST